MTSLFAKLDPIAVLRRAGGGLDPDPVIAAPLAELGGAEGISVTCGREADLVQERDLRLLREVVRTALNICLPPGEEFMKLALTLRPDLVTLVTEGDDGLRSVRGLDVEDRRPELVPLVQALAGGGIGVAVLVDPSPVQVKAAHRLGANAVLLHTGRLAWASGPAARAAEFEALVNAAKVADRLGLAVHAGGGLSSPALRAVAQVSEITAVHVGQALVARAVLVGIEGAVRELLRLLAGNEARR